MRVAIAGFVTESVTFVQQELTLAEFKRAETRGQVMLEQRRD